MVFFRRGNPAQWNRRENRLAAAALFFLVAALANVPALAAQLRPEAKLLLFAKDSEPLDFLKKQRRILGHPAQALGERRHRETYLDTSDLRLYQTGLICRVAEFYDGRITMEFNAPAPASDKPARPMGSITLSPDQAGQAKTGDLSGTGLGDGIPCRETKSASLLVDSHKYGLLLTNNKKKQFLLNLVAGKFVGLSGKKLARTFWGIEIESPPSARNKADLRELKEMAAALASELVLRPAGHSLYQEGIEKTVLLRPEEKLIEPIHVFGGAQGGFVEQFDLPDAVAFTLDGRLVAGDTDNARIKIYTVADGSLSIRIVGRVGTGAGEFGHDLITTLPGGRKIHDQVQGIAVSTTGLIHVLDQGNLRIQVFDPEGRPLPERAIQFRYCPKENPQCPDGLVYPTRKKDYRSLQGLAIDPEGAVYLSDKGTGRIYKFRPDGTYDPAFKFEGNDRATGEPILREPESLAIHREKLFFADERNGNIKIFNRKSGRLIRAFGTERFGGHVEGLAVLDDYLFAVDSNQNRFIVFNVKEEQPVFIQAFAGDFESADGIAIDPTGKFLAVADQGNFRILLYSLPEILGSLRAAAPTGPR
jgi:hypothetical protein